jgi:hypothetical protein
MHEQKLLILKLWRNGIEADDWRASLQDLRTQELVRFSSLEALMRYLEGHTWHSRTGQTEDHHRRKGVES